MSLPPLEVSNSVLTRPCSHFSLSTNLSTCSFYDPYTNSVTPISMPAIFGDSIPTLTSLNNCGEWSGQLGPTTSGQAVFGGATRGTLLKATYNNNLIGFNSALNIDDTGVILAVTYNANGTRDFYRAVPACHMSCALLNHSTQ